MSDEIDYGEFAKAMALERSRELRKHLAELRSKFLVPLKQGGIKRVVMSYDGYGDSLSSADVKFDKSADGEYVYEVAGVDKEEVIDLMMCCAPSGFENNEGGFGEVIYDVDAGVVRNEHNERVESTEYSEEEWRF